MKKTLYTMRIGDYAPDICAITYPLLKHYAHKCGAEFVEIRERKYPDWPIPYETFQIYDLMRERQDDWAIWIDADALICPETPDWTWYLKPDTCAQHGTDPAPIRWQHDEYFRRDGRLISSCNWHAVVPRDCRDFFRPLDDLTLEQAIDRITVVISEAKGTCQAPHLISDYTVSRNIARFGLKYTTMMALQKQQFPDGNGPPCYFHLYSIPDEEKVDQLLLVLNQWFGGLARYQNLYLKWDEETAARMSERLTVARLRAEMKMFREACQKGLIAFKEKEIQDIANRHMEALVKSEGGALSSDKLAELIEQFAEDSIAKTSALGAAEMVIGRIQQPQDVAGQWTLEQLKTFAAGLPAA